ncbi:6e4741f9-f4e4-4cb1-a408-db474f4e51f0 [Sclerotinia trifoliorum]|uniref:peptidyl-tRNA hydrolase n=1 Tax=Sclerotinia trifoliorum TaxID=28548 RepID=A0A8H2VR91_9HELO|nr:6e4741f9-f4e4-4cb1-a408-db474f4e51f0 [Sclerotinia trifoliorum]
MYHLKTNPCQNDAAKSRPRAKKLQATEVKDLDILILQPQPQPQRRTQPQFLEESGLPTPPSSSSSSRSSSPTAKTPTRKQRRQAVLAQSLAQELSSSVIPNSNSNSNPKNNDPGENPPNTQIIHNKLLTLTLTLTNTPTMSPSTRLLICSIGNPAPYTNTLHSAGHTILSLLGSTLDQPNFTKSRSYGNGLLSSGPIYTLWKSTSLMNISGTGVNAAWTTFLRESGSSASAECKLVVIHDEMELAPGKINVKPGSNSPKGHNGLKSIRDSLRGQPYTRIGIGIGRPESRDPGVVAGYVLRKMSAEEKRRIEGCVGKVVEELARLSGE